MKEKYSYKKGDILFLKEDDKEKRDEWLGLIKQSIEEDIKFNELETNVLHLSQHEKKIKS